MKTDSAFYRKPKLSPREERKEKDRNKIQQLEEELYGFQKEERKLQQEQQELTVRIICQENRRL